MSEMIRVPGGTYLMGSSEFYPEEAPVHHVTVDAFWMDTCTVTNQEFQRFVAATGYQTVAERPLNPDDYPGADRELLVPGSLVFQQPTHPVDLRDPSNWWIYVPGANWRHPYGPESSIEDRSNHPVTQIAYEDAHSFAVWAGKDLPSEAEWEFAARGGLEGARYVWGDEDHPEGRIMANTWQGEFPWQHLRMSHALTMPVGSFPPNGYGLFDMAGNVWEWTSDWFCSQHPDEVAKHCCIPMNPRGGVQDQSYDPDQPQIRIPRKVLKGGSYLCAPNYCLRYRPSARSPEMVDTSTCHIGFRCVVRDPLVQREIERGGAYRLDRGLKPANGRKRWLSSLSSTEPPLSSILRVKESIFVDYEVYPVVSRPDVSMAPAAPPRLEVAVSLAWSSSGTETNKRSITPMFRGRREERQEQGQMPPDAGPHRFQMREKILAIGDDFWIENERGEKAYKVDGKVLRARDTLRLEDTRRHVVAEVQQRYLRARDSMAIERDGHKIAEVHKKLINIVREHFVVDMAGKGPDMEVKGNIVDHEFEITQDGRRVAEVSKKWFRIRETYGVEIEPGYDVPLILTVTICLDQMAAK